MNRNITRPSSSSQRRPGVFGPLLIGQDGPQAKPTAGNSQQLGARRGPLRRALILGFLVLSLISFASPAQAVPTYSHDIGRFATAEISPLDVAGDSLGNWYVLDGGLACVRVYGPDRTTIIKTFFTCGVEGGDATHIQRARGFGLDPQTDELWIADTTNKRLVKVDRQGSLLLSTRVSDSPNGPLVDPRDVTVDRGGNAYVTDNGLRIVKVSPTGQYLGEWGSRGSGPGQVNGITSIDFSAVGGDALYVTDGGNYRVAKFGLNGEWLGSFGSRGTGNGQFTRDSRGIAVDSNGTIYAADTGGNRIVRWSADGSPLSSLGGGLPYYRSGPLNFFYGARGLDVTGNVLAISDTWNYRVLHWTLSGSSLGQIAGTPPPPEGHNGPSGVELDSNGNVYVSDYWHQWIQKFSPDGTLLARWGIGRGSAPGTLNFAAGIEVDNVRGRLYIANREERVVDAWSLSDGSFVRRIPVPLRGFPRDVAVNEATGTIYVANEKNLQVDIISADGTVLGLINRYGAGTGQAIGSPFSVARDEQGNLYVADFTKKLIHVYDSEARWLRSFTPLDPPKGLDVRGNTIYVLSSRKIATYTTQGALISRWGTVGFGDADINSPYLGIAVDAAGKLYIGDSGNHRVKVFSP
jgi:tripartite motif-containing protein 71